MPFNVSVVRCNDDPNEHLNEQIRGLENDKAKLTDELIQLKSENQKLFSDMKSHENDLKLSQSNVTQLTRENQTLRAKLKQLMLVTSAKSAPKNEETEEDDVNEYEVEAILDHTGRKGQRKFLIRWKHFPPSFDTWEKESNLNCDEILKDYSKTKGL